jgi:hypothetical protein
MALQDLSVDRENSVEIALVAVRLMPNQLQR